MTTFQVPVDSRLEIKFTGPEIKEELLRRWLELHTAAFYRSHESRWVNNIYFDTHNYRAYEENLSGSSARTKVRFRWYGERTYPDSGVLEIKCKRNYFGWKERFPIDLLEFDESCRWHVLCSKLKKAVPTAAKHWLDFNPFPVMINRYYREYYVSNDNKIRVTIDTKQRFYDQRFKPFMNVNHKTISPAELVVEVKFSRKDRKLASNILQGLPIRVGKNSKYINAVQYISSI